MWKKIEDLRRSESYCLILKLRVPPKKQLLYEILCMFRFLLVSVLCHRPQLPILNPSGGSKERPSRRARYSAVFSRIEQYSLPVSSSEIIIIRRLACG